MSCPLHYTENSVKSHLHQCSWTHLLEALLQNDKTKETGAEAGREHSETVYIAFHLLWQNKWRQFCLLSNVKNRMPQYHRILQCSWIPQPIGLVRNTNFTLGFDATSKFHTIFRWLLVVTINQITIYFSTLVFKYNIRISVWIWKHWTMGICPNNSKVRDFKNSFDKRCL